MTKVNLYTDGSCLGNPGKGGLAAILQAGGHEREISYGYQLTTNNRMELMSVLAGLAALTKGCVVNVFTDSQYVCDGWNKWIDNWKRRGWVTREGKPVPNRDLWEQLLEHSKTHSIRMVKVKGHSGHPENERADVLARSAAAGENLLVDQGYAPALAGDVLA